MAKIAGKFFKGYGIASGCVALQKRFLIEYEPDIVSVFDGTLNFHLERRIQINKYDFETKPVEWRKGTTETIYLLRAKIEFPNTPDLPGEFPCLIYATTMSAYRGRPTTDKVELLMKKIDRTKITNCCISFEQPCQMTPTLLTVG